MRCAIKMIVIPNRITNYLKQIYIVNLSLEEKVIDGEHLCS